MFTNILRRIILGKKEKFLFQSYHESLIQFGKIENEIGVYIHIPFCKSICPFCPYNKIIYHKEMAILYKEALLKEFALYEDKLKFRNITSIYIGGGTPTLLIDELKEVISFIREKFNFNGDIGIEIYPTEVNEEKLMKLKNMGVNLISLGVQTFNSNRLKLLGRNYNEEEIEKAITLIKSYNFKCIDIDIMTNLPGQTIEEIEYDIKKSYSYEIGQLSIYPLILFPMTNLKEHIKRNGLTRFGELKERKILKLIHSISEQYGYSRSSVWTYGKQADVRYTSVTRENFIGFGAGASSLFGNYFYLNTFNVQEYIKALNEGRLPINIVNIMSEKEKMIFWIFWRCYDGVISEKRFKQIFNKDMYQEFKLLFKLLRFFRMAEKEEDKLLLNEWGSFAYHFIEKQYSVYYLNNLWHNSMKEPWIEKLEL